MSVVTRREQHGVGFIATSTSRNKQRDAMVPDASAATPCDVSMAGYRACVQRAVVYLLRQGEELHVAAMSEHLVKQRAHVEYQHWMQLASQRPDYDDDVKRKLLVAAYKGCDFNYL